MRRWRMWAALGALVLVCACALGGVGDYLRGYGRAPSNALADYDLASLDRQTRGEVYFAIGDFGALDTDALETHAVPWRLAGAALVQAEHERSHAPVTAETLRVVMGRFGFLYPETIGNWPAGVAPPRLQGPLGMNIGLIERTAPRIELAVANLGCASCHGGVTYDARGAPRTDTAWLGAPNTSLDLEAYVQGVYRAFATYGGDADALLGVVMQVFPETTATEMKTLRNFVMPRVNNRMARLATLGDRPLPFINGAPGLTNGVAALKMQLAVLPEDAHASQRGFTAIPDLGDRGLRTSLLYDGAYTPAHTGPDHPMLRADITDAHLDGLAVVTAFFTVPSMGVHPDRARGHLDQARDVFRFFNAYEAPRYPGVIDAAKAARGRGIYGARCASCHGGYDESLSHPRLQSFPNRIAPYDSDPTRAAAFTPDLAAAVKASSYGDLITARVTGGYAAPLLTGVWMSAPYLHNGSVATLRQLLTPADRPTRVMAGGHRLNLDSVGIDGHVDGEGTYVYPQGYAPFSAPAVIDTTRPGLSNRGHEKDFEMLSAREKVEIIEYLKLL